MIKGIVFDLDGVLIDATDWHYQALNRALALFGYRIASADHWLNFNGLPTRVKLNLLSQQRGLPRTLHEFIHEMKQRYTQEIILSECRPQAAVSQLLRTLKSAGYRLGVASNSTRATLDLVLDSMGLRAYFDAIFSHEDVGQPKPSPDIYFQCFARLGITAPEALVIEDSGPGIEAARASGAHVMIVRAPSEVTLERIEREIDAANRQGGLSDAAESAPRIEIVIPMAGSGQRFIDAGYQQPKPFIEIFGRPMINWVIDNIRPSAVPHRFTFLCNEKQLREYRVESLLKEIAPGCQIVSVPSVTQGAACTVLLAADHINPDWPLLIANSDQWVDMNIDDFIGRATSSRCDGLILTFPANDKKWSYANCDETGRVTEVAEKDPISPHATVGIYYFRQTRDFIASAKQMIRREIRTNGEFYVCPVYNEAIRQGREIRTLEIPAGAMHGLGTPEDLQAFQNWRLEYEAQNRGNPLPIE